MEDFHLKRGSNKKKRKTVGFKNKHSTEGRTLPLNKYLSNVERLPKVNFLSPSNQQKKKTEEVVRRREKDEGASSIFVQSPARKEPARSGVERTRGGKG